MRKSMLALTAAALVAAPAAAAIAQSVPQPAVPQAAGEISTPDYARQAAQIDMLEIAAAQVALSKSSNAKVKTFAQHMVHDHTETSSKLKAALSADSAATPPMELDEAHKAQLELLKQSSGEQFDRLYAKSQVDGHTMALQLHQNYAQAGSDSSLKALAASMAAVVSGHLADARALAAEVD